MKAQSVSILLIILLQTIFICNQCFIPISRNIDDKKISYQVVTEEKTSIHSAYAPVTKSPVSEGDELVFDVEELINDTLWEGQHKYIITSIENIYGIQNISADRYNKSLENENWGAADEVDLSIGSLTLNHIFFSEVSLIQHQYFFFKFQGYSDGTDGEQIHISEVESYYSVDVSESSITWLDFFIPQLDLTVSNASHSGSISFRYDSGILVSKCINLTTLTPNESIYFSSTLNYGESSIEKKNYNFWGDPLENVGLNAEDQIINTDQLVYSFINSTQDNPETQKIRFTVTSIDPDPYFRDTVITTTREKYLSESSEWLSQGSELIIIDHTTPFKLNRYQTNFLVLPTIFSFTTQDTIEEMEATKYWLEEFQIWTSFNYTFSKNSFDFSLSSPNQELYVHGSYGIGNIITEYELLRYEFGIKTEYLKYELQIYESTIDLWLTTPPISPTLELISEIITENPIISLSWNIPYFTESVNIYSYRRIGTVNTSTYPNSDQFIITIPNLKTKTMNYTGQVNSTYFFRIKGVNPGGTESQFSNTVKVLIEVAEKKPFPTWLIFLGIFCLAGIGLSIYWITKIKKTQKKETVNFEDFS